MCLGYQSFIRYAFCKFFLHCNLFLCSLSFFFFNISFSLKEVVTVFLHISCLWGCMRKVVMAAKVIKVPHNLAFYIQICNPPVVNVRES